MGLIMESIIRLIIGLIIGLIMVLIMELIVGFINNHTKHSILKTEEKELLNQFKSPEYAKYELVFVDDVSRADLKTSPENNVFDYLAIGVVCLFKQITGCNEKTVYVWNHESYSINESIIAYCKEGTRTMQNNALSDFLMHGTCKYFLRKYFQEDTPYSVQFADFFLYVDITTIHMGLQKVNGIALEFEDFNDTIAAQQFAFNTLRTLMISHWLGDLKACI